jgi:pseudaminic acid biosynthesis-associated methylase
MEYKTEQEIFWAGKFGEKYIDRNNSDQLLNSKVALWSQMLRCANNIKSIRELGCNIGLNLVALKRLQPSLNLFGHEINEEAVKQANNFQVAKITHGSILDNIDEENVDLTFTSGVLIHINPDYLKNVYENLVFGSKRYILVAEYFNPTPVQNDYRGNSDKLFKRDFAGDLIDGYGLSLIDYGFVYSRDNWSPQDNVTWFLLEKR